MPDYHPKERGQQSEAAVLHACVERGFTVLSPFGDNERYDYVIEHEDEFFRVQVKTGRFEEGSIQFETRSSGTLTRKVVKEDYRGDADVFAVYSPDLDQVFVVPVTEAPDTTMRLRVEEAKKKSPNINWAQDFRIDHWMGELNQQ